jgi:hypothetical protein
MLKCGLHQMGSATDWVRRHPGALLLLAAIVAGQVLKALTQPHLQDSPLVGRVPLVPAASLAAALVLAALILMLRIRLGQQLVTAAKARAIALPDPASLPKRYAVSDPATQVTSAALGLLDLALLLLVQATLLGPVLALADRFLVRRTWADSAFVALVVLLALLLLLKLWRMGGPVLVLLLWWALDRVVPTAGFLGSRAEVAAAPTTVARPVASSPRLAQATVAADVPTVASGKRADGEATVRAEATVLSHATNDDATVVSHVAGDDATVVSHATHDDATVVSHTADDDATVVKPESA